MAPELRADVRMLGEVLGQVLLEFGGPSLLEDVRRLRELTIDAHGDDRERSEASAAAAEALVGQWTPERAEEVARAFAVFFHLVNLAEESHRVRLVRRRTLDPESPVSAVGAVVQEVEQEQGRAHAQAALAGLEVRPVLTAHPTEARRRSVVRAIRRVAALLDRLDDSRQSEADRRECRRQLVEEVDVLWRTALLRHERPGPLDEVRSVMAVFDEVLFRVVPQVYRRAELDLAGLEAGRVPPRVLPWLRFGSWIGGDRDGNPFVTSTVTRQAMSIQADHVLRALENAATRIGWALTVDAVGTPPSPGVRRRIADAHVDHPELMERITTRSPTEPHRVAMLLVAERLRATRERDADLAYERPGELLADLHGIQRSLAAAGAVRPAYGELQHLIWQAETFGFHLASLEVRQHSQVHAQALAEIRDGGQRSDLTEEVLATLRVMAQVQQRYGTDACRRYVVSFTRSAADVAAVFALAEEAVGDRPLVLDVVPLFETGDDLAHCVEVLDEVITLPQVRRRLSATGRSLEVMLGYSDSAKDIGPVSATLALYAAQSRLTAWAARHAIRLTLFHGRGGALGRGGGPVGRAVLAQPAGSVSGRFKITEQGEVIFARYGDPALAALHLDGLTGAVLRASTPAAEARTAHAQAEYGGLAERLDTHARAAYHGLVGTDGFAEWFARATPLEAIGALPLGSRPARRGLTINSLADLRAIPWVFAWAQSRANVPGWFGLGSALSAEIDGLAADGPDGEGGLALLQRAYAEWPLFQVTMDNAEMALAKADRRIFTRLLAVGGRPDIVDIVAAEYDRAVEGVLAVTGQRRLLERRSVLGPAVRLRSPYIDALSFLQLHALRALRDEQAHTEAEATAWRRVLLLTLNGVAAGLQNTG
jgi:phosphoenolpyruvate carboxylase